MSEGSVGIDFSELDDFSSLLQKPKDVVSSGRMMFVPIADVVEDPDQPRKEFNSKSLDELADSMRSIGPNGKPRGVKSPLSVKPKGEDGKYIINHGARRFRAANIAELTEIPIFVDPDHDKVDQVIENIQREDLTPLEIAHFVQEQIKAGQKKMDIAKSLGKPLSFVSNHALFFDFPDCIRDLYDTGKCRTVQALAILHRAHKSNTDAVEQFCNKDHDITYAKVNDFSTSLKEVSGESGQPSKSSKKEPASNEGVEGDSGESRSGSKSEGMNDPSASNLDEIKKALVIVLHDKREARLVINRRAAKGFGWIKYDDSGDSEEVCLTDISLQEIIEG